MTARAGWVDTSSGVSGDMLLGALTAVGAVDVVDVAARLGVDVTVTVEPVTRGGLAALAVRVVPASDQPHRQLADVVSIVAGADLADDVRERAVSTFRRLAVAEAAVHGVAPEQVEFHEVGALDTIVDVVAACSGFAALRLDRLVVSPVALGGGTAQSQHGRLPVPVPAVLELLRESVLVGHGGPVDVELATPTGVALLAEWATGSGPLPPVGVHTIGIGAGTRDLDAPNVVRLVVGASAPEGSDDGDGWQVLACNVDDLDPRLWPVVLDRLLAAGAADAWLAPIVMKKGRPAHTLSVLVADAVVDAVADVLFAESSTIGVRSTRVSKRALDREWIDVDVDGARVRVKIARSSGAVVNVSPEFDDVVRVATELSRPVKSVLAAAAAAAHARLR